MKRRAFLTATLGLAARRRLGARHLRHRFRPTRPNAIGRDKTRCAIPIPTSSPSIIASAATSCDNTPIRRLHTGTLWAEGPAWNGVGRYLVWSDAPNNVQMRYIEDDARVTVFRNPSGNSNGNTFDHEGRQLSCEHGNRRVVRYEQNGTVTVIAAHVPGQTLEFPERHRRASRRQHLVHRSDLRHSRLVRRQQGRFRDQARRLSLRHEIGSARAAHRRDVRDRTASVSRRTTRSSTSPTPAPAVRFARMTSMAGASGTAVDMRSSPSRDRPRVPPAPMACVATRTAIYGRGAAGCADHRA